MLSLQPSTQHHLPEAPAAGRSFSLRMSALQQVRLLSQSNNQLRQMAVQSDAAGGAELNGAAGGAASDAVQAGVEEDQADSTNEQGVAPGDGGDSAHE